MSYDFPSSPAIGQTFGNYIWNGAGWQMYGASPPVATAETRNRIVNGAMQVSQENGNTALGPTGVMNSYAADQWLGVNAIDGTCTQQRVQVTTPNGSVNRIRLTVNTADAALVTTQFQTLLQNIEGSRVVDFRYGTASAKQSILRFGWKSPAGTYSAGLFNSAANRSYVANFTITAGQANTDTEQVLIIPGDTTGTWLTDTGIGIGVRFNIGAGPTVSGAAGWQAGNVSSITGSTNGLAAAGAVYELFDVGLYLDPDTTGVPPKWTMPDEAEELRACQRYWQKCLVFFSGNTTTALAYYSPTKTPVEPRTTPTLTGVNMGALAFPGTVGPLNAGWGVGYIVENRTANATGNGSHFETTIYANARM